MMGMDCRGDEYQSLEDVCRHAKARMPASARMGLPASYSTGSVASSEFSYDECARGEVEEETEDDEDDREPELSRSFESTKSSFFPVTPARVTFNSSRPGGFHRNTSSSSTSGLSSCDGYQLTQGSTIRKESFSASPRSTIPPSRMLFREGYPAAQAAHQASASSASMPASPRGLSSPIMSHNSSSSPNAINMGSSSSGSSASSSRCALGQSLGLSTIKVKSSSPNAPTNGSPLAARADLPTVDENTNLVLPQQTSTLSPASAKGPSNLAQRRKLPPLAIAGAAFESPTKGTHNLPHTPGGSIFHGARDGAAQSDKSPVSPFVPPTPLVAAHQQDQQPSSANHFPGMSQPDRKNSMPNSLLTPYRSPMLRTGSLGPMSPLSREFANVSMTTGSSSSMRQIPTSPRVSVGSYDSSISGSSSRTSSTGLTPPFSPSPLSDEPLSAASGPSSRRSSGDSLGPTRTKKRSKDGDSELTRPKFVKSKSTNRVSPYPSASTSNNNLVQLQQQQSQPQAPPSQQQQAVSSAMPVAVAKRAPMEKSLSVPSRPAEPKTVSGKHLSTRTLHPSFAHQYSLGDELGSGGFGFVVGAHRNVDGRPVAVKFIWKEKVPSHGWVRDPSLGVIPLEAFVLRVVDHPCVVKFIDLFDDDEFFYLVMEMHGTPWAAPEAAPPATVDNSPTPKASVQQQVASTLVPASPQVAVYAPDSPHPSDAVMLSSSPLSAEMSTLPSPISTPSSTVPNKSLAAPPRPAPMERRTSRDLFECIEQHTRFSEEVASWVFAQIVEAVYYLGKLGICHRDIKDENCVIDSDWNVKLIDFGSAVVSDPRKPAPYFDRFFGTMTFASAEILQGRQYRAPHAEVWSLGVLLSILLSGECPFSEPSAAMKGRVSSKVRNSWSSEPYNLLCGCVAVDPERRATIEEVREHPWVKRAWEVRGLRRPEVPQPY